MKNRNKYMECPSCHNHLEADRLFMKRYVICPCCNKKLMKRRKHEYTTDIIYLTLIYLIAHVMEIKITSIAFLMIGIPLALLSCLPMLMMRPELYKMGVVYLEENSH